MKKYVIYADGFKEYEFDDIEKAQAKLTELVTKEETYRFKRSWYMRIEEIEETDDCQWG